jgi:hypothetical protein
MKMKKWLIMMLLTPLIGYAEQPPRPGGEVLTQSGQKISIVKLGVDRFKIGNIVLDKTARSFEVPGKFLRTEPPIEFLAVAKKGHRGYESLLEFDTNVYEFNLACILIGLDTHKGLPPKAHFDPTPVEGDAVEITLRWEANSKKYEHLASDFFLFNNEKLASGNWVYTGSTFLPNGGYMADVAGGTLVGFVHDPASIIEHGQGFGSQSYSNLKLNQQLMPVADTPLKATFKYAGNTQK